ncbi:GUN4 domain-containing protein [Leptolyngbya boryana CZ1]|uniref:GUN4 domain-containing protein n=1 Tax=Leptolyngbya boryana CZ1 TaxID=3060204 RepID=A0AA96WYR7_LEPBY|nr:GUN4 domain-containing protein [Leptolyngbya boryana]WNZ48150.1 GUN4 domain-containing protein [Leptolyngbya boryana CZ1]
MRKFALLVGVSKSSEEDLPALPSAIEDIRAMQTVLQNPEIGGFDSVVALPNPTRQEMEEAIETLFANCEKEDLVLFYFSGHGITDERGKLYLVTPQTRKERGKLIKATAVTATVLHDNMSSSRSKHQVLILDSCFSGAIAEGLTSKSAETKVDIQKELGGEGRAILTSSNAVQKSFHIQGYNLSIYTHYLIDGIQTGTANQDGDDYISVDELHEYAKKKLEQEAPSMSPQFFPVKEGYKIRLVRSPKVIGKLEFNSTQHPLDAIILESEKGIDYSKLRDLLKAGKWSEADEETRSAILKAANRGSAALSMDSAEFKRIPYRDLKTIDQLWVTSSNGHFGFSVQKKIWQECGSPTNSGKYWYNFCVRIGWMNQKKTHYTGYQCLRRNQSTSPKGELPSVGLRLKTYFGVGSLGKWSFCSLLEREDL